MNPTSPSPNAIAVVGMSGRFPGADSVSAFWTNLRLGEESIATLSAEELAAAGIEQRGPRKSVVRPPSADPGRHRRVRCRFLRVFPAGGPDDGSAAPDVPAVRLACARGRRLSTPPVTPVRSVFTERAPPVDISATTCFRTAIWTPSWARARTSTSSAFPSRTTRTSWQPGCRTSSTCADPASPCRPPARRRWSRCTWPARVCSTGKCDMALAGGVSIRIPHHVGYWYEPGSIVSPAGHCRPFDVRADGTVFGSGVAIVVLEPLQAALDARGSDSRRHQGVGGQQRRLDEDRIRRAQRRRTGRRHRRGARRGRRRFVDDRLRRDTRNRDATRRPDRNRGAATSVRGVRDPQEQTRACSGR